MIAATHSSTRFGPKTAAAWTVGLIFIAAAVAKARDPASFGFTIAHLCKRLGFSPLNDLGYRLVVGVVALEFALGSLLLFGRRRRELALVTAVVLGAFTAALVLLVLDPAAPSCECFGALRDCFRTVAEAV